MFTKNLHNPLPCLYQTFWNDSSFHSFSQRVVCKYITSSTNQKLVRFLKMQFLQVFITFSYSKKQCRMLLQTGESIMSPSLVELGRYCLPGFFKGLLFLTFRKNLWKCYGYKDKNCNFFHCKKIVKCCGYKLNNC